jgi:hypothetical protein
VDEQNSTSDQPSVALAWALGAAGLPPRDRYAFFTDQGVPALQALETVLCSMRSVPPRKAWKRVIFTAELLEEGCLGLEEGITALRNLGIHPLSLAGTGQLPLDPAALEQLALPAGCTLERIPYKPGLVLTGDPGIEQLPPGLRFWSLHLRHFPRLVDLGTDLEVVQELRIDACGLLQRLPATLGRISRVWIEGCSSLAGIPASLVSDKLWLKDLPGFVDLALPLGFSGQLSLGRCQRLRSLSVPAGRLKAVDFYDCGLDHLDGLRLVQGNFSAQHSPGFRWIPANLEIAGSMQLTALPGVPGLGPGLRIGGNLEMQQMPRDFVLPEDLEIGGQIILSPATGNVIAPDRLQDKIVEIP